MCCCHEHPVASSVATFTHLEGYGVEEERESKAMTLELLMYIHLPWMAKGDTTAISTVRPGVQNVTVSQVLSQFWRTSSFFRFYSFMQGEAVIFSALSTSGTTVRYSHFIMYFHRS